MTAMARASWSLKRRQVRCWSCASLLPHVSMWRGRTRGITHEPDRPIRDPKGLPSGRRTHALLAHKTARALQRASSSAPIDRSARRASLTCARYAKLRGAVKFVFGGLSQPAHYTDAPEEQTSSRTNPRRRAPWKRSLLVSTAAVPAPITCTSSTSCSSGAETVGPTPNAEPMQGPTSRPMAGLMDVECMVANAAQTATGVVTKIGGLAANIMDFDSARRDRARFAARDTSSSSNAHIGFSIQSAHSKANRRSRAEYDDGDEDIIRSSPQSCRNSASRGTVVSWESTKTNPLSGLHEVVRQHSYIPSTSNAQW